MHTAVTGEIIGRAWRAPTRKVSGRANDDDLHGSHHANGNHVDGRPVARSDASIKSLRHDIDRRHAHRDLEMDVRVGRQEAPQIGAMTADAATWFA